MLLLMITARFIEIMAHLRVDASPSALLFAGGIIVIESIDRFGLLE